MYWKYGTLCLMVMVGLVAAQPIVKTGDCPQLTRYDAPSGENWSQFPVEPNPQSQFPTGTVQDPLTPQQSVNCTQVPTGLQAQIIASELTDGTSPALAYLMYFTFDERGRVWALDVRDYPGPIASNRATGGDGRIVILEDVDQDGAMDNFKVFYDGLAIPTSLVMVDGGVVVSVAPYIYFIPNNNDVGGTPQVLFSGMGSSGNYDTHGQINSMMYGLDNWIYGHTGYNGCNTNGVNCGGGRTWRFKHTAIGHSETDFQLWTTGPANAHGIGQMEDGQIFQSGATGTPHNNHSIRRGVAAVNVTNSNSYYPITGDRFMWEGSTNGSPGSYSTGSSAASGHDFYTARLLPEDYWNVRSFVCEGASKLCNQDNMDLDGSTWDAVRLSRQQSNIIASTDAWFAPLKMRTGPDGGLWVVDWYNYLFLHNPAQPSISGTGAWQNHLRDKDKTRLYRIIPEDGSSDPFPDMITEADLVAALGHSNFVWRLLAQRQLIYRGFTATLGDALENILTNRRMIDDVGNDPQVTHAVWVLEGLGQFSSDAARWNPILADLLLHPAWGTRRNVLMAMPRTQASSQAIVDQCAVNDDHAHVRLQAMVALKESPDVSNETDMWTQFDNVDGHITTARNEAGIGTTGTRPCQPDYDEVVSLAFNPKPDYKLKFKMFPGGIGLVATPHLSSGVLTLYDVQGRVFFQTSYDLQESYWKESEVLGLKKAVYFYKFVDNRNRILEGKIAVF